VVDFYGFSLQHETSDAKITVQICMELMRGGSLRDNLLVLKRKGLTVSLPVAFSIIRQVSISTSTMSSRPSGAKTRFSLTRQVATFLSTNPKPCTLNLNPTF
jgi:hypothetical protein